MNKNLSTKALLKIINQALVKQGISARQASILATGGPELIRSIRRGSIPSIERIRALCKVLELEFYIGPTRSGLVDSIDSFEEKRTIDGMFREIMSRLPPNSSYRKIAEPKAPYASESHLIHYIPVLEMKATTGKIAGSKDYQKSSHVAFHSNWLAKHKLNFEHCVIMKVQDKSMEPTIAKHSIVLIDCSQHRRQIGVIYAIRINDNIVVKRLEKNKGQWYLTSDHPKWNPKPFPASAEVIGRVKWTAKTFV